MQGFDVIKHFADKGTMGSVDGLYWMRKAQTLKFFDDASVIIIQFADKTCEFLLGHGFIFNILFRRVWHVLFSATLFV